MQEKRGVSYSRDAIHQRKAKKNKKQRVENREKGNNQQPQIIVGLEKRPGTTREQDSEDDRLRSTVHQLREYEKGICGPLPFSGGERCFKVQPAQHTSPGFQLQRNEGREPNQICSRFARKIRNALRRVRRVRFGANVPVNKIDDRRHKVLH